MRNWDNAFKGIRASNLVKFVLESLKMHRGLIRALSVVLVFQENDMSLRRLCIRFLGFVLNLHYLFTRVDFFLEEVYSTHFSSSKDTFLINKSQCHRGCM